MERIKTVNYKNISLTLCGDDYKKEALVLPSEDAYIRKFYDSDFSMGVAALSTALLAIGILASVFFVLPIVFSENTLTDSVLFWFLIVFIVLALLSAAILHIWRMESLSKIVDNSEKYISLPLSDLQYKYVSYAPDEQIADFYRQALRIHDLRMLLDKIDKKLGKDIEEFVKNDLRARRKSLFENYRNAQKSHDEALKEIKEAIDVVVKEEKEKERVRKTSRDNREAIDLLSAIDSLEEKTKGF